MGAPKKDKSNVVLVQSEIRSEYKVRLEMLSKREKRTLQMMAGKIIERYLDRMEECVVRWR